MWSIDAVLFDIGHTLAYRRGEHDLLVEAARDLGVDLDPHVAEALWDRVQEEARTPEAMSRGRDLSPDAHRREWLRLWSPADSVVSGLAERIYRAERDPATWELYPDVMPVLDDLRRRGLPLGIVSDTGWDYSEVLARHGIKDRFDAIVMSFEHGAMKPAPALFHSACDQLGVSPARTLMVGDNAWPDGGAVTAGLPVLLLPAVAPGTERGLRAVLALAALPPGS
jgi:HAD superfamily hydrolase (TIGR01509 family)